MAMESFATPYPVIFNDGERDHDKGQIGVHSVLTFKRFQALLSQKVGLPAIQLSAVFVCKRTAKDTDKRQKLPINDNTNFNIILNQHNPMWEKDCHFLVSLKKSKKERKGTRRRNAEAENGDEDCSVSPRSSTSPKDERPKPDVSVVTGVAREATPTSTREPQLSHQSSEHSATVVSERIGHPDGRFSNGKILLRRESTSLSSPPPKGDKQVKPVPVGGALLQGSSGCQTDMPNVNKERLSGESVEAKLMLRSEQKLGVGWPSHHPAVVSQSSGEAQERYSDTFPVRPTLLLQKNGVLQLPGSVGSAPSFPPSPAVRPVMYHSPATMVLSRAPNGAPLTLQQAQAQYLHLQAQRPDQVQLNSQALSKMRGVVRDLAAYENGNHKPSGVCQHCCIFRERNISPTPFHLCVHDKVANGFRGPSPAGPIERPAKRVEAAA